MTSAARTTVYVLLNTCKARGHTVAAALNIQPAKRRTVRDSLNLK